MSRTVTLVLVDAAGAVLGAVPPFEVSVPWWQEVAEVVAEVRRCHGAEVDVLRLLRADRPGPPGGAVTYLAELRAGRPAGIVPVAEEVTDHRARADWARPGGPRSSVEWALRQLGRLENEAGAATRARYLPSQVRTWNLSAFWRLDAGGAPVAWLKQVPPFFAHEAAVLRLLDEVAPGLAPRPLAVGSHGRILLPHLPGEDRYGAGVALRAAVAADIHAVHQRLAGAATELIAAGVPDRRHIGGPIRSVAEARGAGIAGLGVLLDTLDERLAEVAECGVPDTLLHGDLHPGNVRGDGPARGVIDWGDSCLGHPGFDILRLTEGLPAADAAAMERAWAHRWRASIAGCHPERALALLRPVAALRAAVTYADFLDRIEPSEWPYHEADVAAQLRSAVDIAERDGGYQVPPRRSRHGRPSGS